MAKLNRAKSFGAIAVRFAADLLASRSGGILNALSSDRILRAPRVGVLALTLVLFVLVMLFAGAACRAQQPVPPPESSDRPKMVASHESVVAIPFRLNIVRAQSTLAGSALMDTLDSHWRSVDCRAVGGDAPAAGFACDLYVSVGQVLGAGNEYRYTIAPDRSSLALRSVRGAASEASFTIDMNVGYSVRLRGKSGTFSCGDPARDMNPVTKKHDYLHFHMHETVRLLPTAEYGIQATFAHTLVPDAPCRMRVLLPVDRDITSTIADIENKAVAQGEAKLRERLRGYAPKLATGAKNAWRSLARPYAIAPQPAAYLLLHPKTLAMLPYTASGQGDRLSIEGRLLIGVAPEIVTSAARPAPLVPLPRFREASRKHTSDVILADATLGYAAANAILRKRLVGQRVREGVLPPVTITNVTVYPTQRAGTAKLAIRIDYRGTLRGSLYAWGTPRYKAATRAISIPDLQLTPGKNGILGRIVRPLLQRKKLIETVRSEVARDLTDEFRKLNVALIRTYERNVASGVKVEGRVSHVDLRTISPTQPGITANFGVTGSLRVDATLDATRVLDMRHIAVMHRATGTSAKR